MSQGLVGIIRVVSAYFLGNFFFNSWALVRVCDKYTHMLIKVATSHLPGCMLLFLVWTYHAVGVVAQFTSQLRTQTRLRCFWPKSKTTARKVPATRLLGS